MFFACCELPSMTPQLDALDSKTELRPCYSCVEIQLAKLQWKYKNQSLIISLNNIVSLYRNVLEMMLNINYFYVLPHAGVQIVTHHNVALMRVPLHPKPCLMFCWSALVAEPPPPQYRRGFVLGYLEWAQSTWIFASYLSVELHFSAVSSSEVVIPSLYYAMNTAKNASPASEKISENSVKKAISLCKIR